MADERRAFLDFAIECGVLRFGEFTLKSGRVSPYFFNAGLFHSGASLSRLGSFYAQAAAASGISFDMLFGPAYKGIPLATATAIALARDHQRDVPWCFNRKETKDHGEGGNLVGAAPTGRVLIVDDVMTAGTAAREAVTLLREHGAEPAGIVVALDRQEQGANGPSAVQEVEQELGLRVISIATLADLVSLLRDDPRWREHAVAVSAYRDRYGVK